MALLCSSHLILPLFFTFNRALTLPCTSNFVLSLPCTCSGTSPLTLSCFMHIFSRACYCHAPRILRCQCLATLVSLLCTYNITSHLVLLICFKFNLVLTLPSTSNFVLLLTLLKTKADSLYIHLATRTILVPGTGTILVLGTGTVLVPGTKTAVVPRTLCTDLTYLILKPHIIKHIITYGTVPIL